MRTSLQNIYLLMMITAIMLGCRADEDIQTFDFSGDWKVSSFVDLKTSEIIIKTEENTWNQLNNADNIIRFEKTDATKGVVSGINVTNSFYGVYTTGCIVTLCNHVHFCHCCLNGVSFANHVAECPIPAKVRVAGYQEVA